MAKAFSIASWNVEHFKGDPTRTNRVISFLKDQKPDVIGLYEVQGSKVFTEVTNQFPNYTFQITEGPQAQEILVGFKSSISAFLTQKLAFKAGTTHMRPGLLATITISGQHYMILFLHLASSPEPRGFGLRDDMAIRAIKFKKVLDKAVGGQANYIFLGDLNSMGLNYPYKNDIEVADELKRWDSRASQYYDMHRLDKTFELTWSNGSTSSYEDANLDHVYASKHMEFKSYNSNNGKKCLVDVRGWVNKTSIVDKDKWIDDYSDHSLLFLEVQKV